MKQLVHFNIAKKQIELIVKRLKKYFIIFYFFISTVTRNPWKRRFDWNWNWNLLLPVT